MFLLVWSGSVSKMNSAALGELSAEILSVAQKVKFYESFIKYVPVKVRLHMHFLDVAG